MDRVTGIGVRTATTADGAALVQVDRDGFDQATTPGSAPGADADPWARHDPDDVLVAVLDDRVVGYLTLGRPTLLPSNAHVWQVQGLAVHPDARRQGGARALLRAGVEEARTRGARRLTLRVLSTNPTAQALYASEGFEVEGVLRGEFVIDGAEVDDVLMARRLG